MNIIINKILIGGMSMRRKRFRAMKIRKNYNYTLIILFLIVIPLVAIFLGSRITERIVMPVLYSDLPLEEDVLEEIINSDNLNDESSDNEEILNQESEVNNDVLEEQATSDLLPLSVFMIQIASVSDTANIESFVEELNEKKLPHLIYKIDNAYKVYILGLTNRMFVETQLPYAREYYPDAYISEIHLPAKKISYDKSKEETSEGIIKDLNSLIEIMDKQAKEWYNFINKQSELDTYKELLIQQQTLAGQLLEKVKDENIPEGLPKSENIEKMIHHQESNIKHSLELLEDEENIYRLHSLFLDNLFRMLETIK